MVKVRWVSIVFYLQHDIQAFLEILRNSIHIYLEAGFVEFNGTSEWISIGLCCKSSGVKGNVPYRCSEAIIVCVCVRCRIE